MVQSYLTDTETLLSKLPALFLELAALILIDKTVTIAEADFCA